MASLFAPYLDRWALTIDGEPFASLSGRLQPVRWRGRAAMLKVSHTAEEQAGHGVMVWWEGDGAATVFAHDGQALLMDRAQGSRSLAQMSKGGQDDEATRILCATIARLHAPRDRPRPELRPLDHAFGSLWSTASRCGGLFKHSALTAQTLLAAPRDVTVLHGDIHHGNVLDFGPAGWLAIDPKGLHGERGFDHANLFCNPDADSALAPGRFARRLDLVAQTVGIERRRLLQWVLAWSGLSMAWKLEDGLEPGGTMEIAQLAASALGATN